MSSFTTTIPNLLFEEAERNGKTRNFRMCIGPGSDGSSADKLSLDLKFNLWDTAVTFRPEWRSMYKTVSTQYDPHESWYREQSDVWLDDVKNVLSSTNALCDRCSSVFSCTGGHSFVGRICLSVVRKKTNRRLPFFSRPAQGQARDSEREPEERNIQQRSIHR